MLLVISLLGSAGPALGGYLLGAEAGSMRVAAAVSGLLIFGVLHALVALLTPLLSALGARAARCGRRLGEVMKC